MGLQTDGIIHRQIRHNGCFWHFHTLFV